LDSVAVCTESEPRRVSESGMSLAFQPIADLSAGRAYAYEAQLNGRNGEGLADLFQTLDPEARPSFDRKCATAAVRWAASAGLAQSGARLVIPVHAAAVDAAPGEHIVPVLRAARESGIVPERLIFSFLDYRTVPGARLAEIIDVYRKLGCLVAFVGLGSDQAGLGTCGRYMPDLVKLEPELVNGIASSWSRRIVLEELMPRLRSLRLKPVATGVDDEAVLQKLGSFGIHLAQGNEVAPPQVGALPPPALRRAA
jgi:EAL domain-containing protein (putative c-di-GMP-specific phosphodiesterase class I)